MSYPQPYNTVAWVIKSGLFLLSVRSILRF